MSLRAEIEADFNSAEVDEDLFEDVVIANQDGRAMVSDNALMTDAEDEGGGFVIDGEKTFKFRRADNYSITENGIITYGGDRYYINSIVNRPNHPLIITTARKQ